MAANVKVQERALQLAEELPSSVFDLWKTTNKSFFPLYTDTSRYLILKGGGGSGKSIFAGRKILERAAEPRYHRFLVVRKVKQTLGETCFQQLVRQANMHFPGQFRITESPMRMIHKRTKNRIVFEGLDDVDKRKSIYGISDIWIEEATDITEYDFDQLDIRRRHREPDFDYSQIIMTFNPVSATHWIKKRFFDKKHPKATIHESTFRDNKFLSDEDIEAMRLMKETNPYYYQVFYLNQWGVTGETVFNAELVTERLAEVQDKKHRLCRFEYEQATDVRSHNPRIDSPRLIDSPFGSIKIYKDVEPGAFYVIGGDPAGEGADEYVGQVIDNTTGEQVAVLCQKMDAHEYADQMYCLGKHYNDALMSIETNAGGHYIIERLARLGYRKLYVREKVDSVTRQTVNAFGFNTNKTTRMPIIENLVEALSAKETMETINDAKTLDQMLTFVRDEHGRPAAEAGAHDDHVMALAIAHYTRGQQRMTKPEFVKHKPVPFHVESTKGINDYLGKGDKLEVI